MKFCALVSGGKDSCMNILYAQKQGHELVACANLRPKPNRPEEIDSFMFQTVGAKCLAHLAQCLDVPLYTHELDEENENHEIDNVVQVLEQVLLFHPDVEAVSVGAIGSVYQQVRVDTACQRLGLTCLAFLWQRDQSQLLQDIINSGMESRMIKVAGYGLNDTHLGKTLAQLQPVLMNLHEKWGLYPCGEGGEYETMVFDGPQFKKRMVMVNPQIVEHSSGDVYYLTFDTTVEDKSVQQENEVLEPPFWDCLWDELELLPNISWKSVSEHVIQPRKTFCKSFKGSSLEVFRALEHFYEGHDIKQTIHVCVLLDDMANFASLNKLYNELFDFIGPPSRKCISAEIPHQVEITVFGGQVDLEAKGLHVQGRSYWAPANIGPYSQARSWYGMAFLAGQIGLAPATLQLVTGAEDQCKLSLQNALRIIKTMHGDDNWVPTTSIAYITDPATRPIVEGLWPFALPLTVALVNSLPRGAISEWDITSIDLRYVNGHPPDEDQLEEGYEYSPIFVKKDNGYECVYGNQKISVSTSELETTGFTTILSTREQGSIDNAAVIPVKELYYDGAQAESVRVVMV